MVARFATIAGAQRFGVKFICSATMRSRVVAGLLPSSGPVPFQSISFVPARWFASDLRNMTYRRPGSGDNLATCYDLKTFRPAPGVPDRLPCLFTTSLLKL